MWLAVTKKVCLEWYFDHPTLDIETKSWSTPDIQNKPDTRHPLSFFKVETQHCNFQVDICNIAKYLTSTPDTLSPFSDPGHWPILLECRMSKIARCRVSERGLRVSGVDVKYFAMLHVDWKITVLSVDFKKWKWSVECRAYFGCRVLTNF